VESFYSNSAQRKSCGKNAFRTMVIFFFPIANDNRKFSLNGNDGFETPSQT